jgi:hypothetical protein
MHKYCKVELYTENYNFNNISVTCISWHSVLLVEKTLVPWYNHGNKLDHIMLYCVHLDACGNVLDTNLSAYRQWL